MRSFIEMEEMTSQNIRGGRPMGLGHTVFQGSDKTDIQTITEETSIRYHAGYCSGCGKKIVMSYATASELAKVLYKRGVRPRAREIVPVRLAKWLLKVHKAKQTYCG